MNKTKFLLAFALLLTTHCATKPTETADARVKHLNELLDEQWQHNLKTHPEFASTIGDYRYNDLLTDVSEAAMLTEIEAQKQFLKRFEEIDPAGFSDQDRLNRALMIRDLKLLIEGAKFHDWREPVNQMSGIHIDFPQLVQLLPFTTAKEYRDYIARLNSVPAQFEATIENMRLGQKEGAIPPKYLLEKVSGQAKKVIRVSAEQSPFAQPLKNFPKTISAKERGEIRTALLKAIKGSVTPSYEKFILFMEKEYAPVGRAEFGIWSIPDGAHRYAYYVKTSTTTDKGPDEIHKIGLSEVARIEGEMLKTANKLGFKDLKSMNEAIEKNKSLRAKSRDQIVKLYKSFEDQMEPKLTELFGRLPKAKLEVRPIERYQEKESAGAFYNQGTPDGSRPGHIMVNTGDFASRKTINIETTAYHEGLPGHHMQISIAQELQSLPPFRRYNGNTAYVEGWALYSEHLGEELGFYKDPYSYYGHLQDEMLRAIRLVVDTGVHYKRWSRQQMVDFFHDHSAIDEVDVQSETDRYIVWPSQALGYKIGQLKILELRDWAKNKLGPKFDIRGFHDLVLEGGSLPLDVLEAQVQSWAAHRL